MSRVEDLLQLLTLEEKVSLAAGSDFWHTVAVPRLGIPRVKVSDGPNGARGDLWDGDTTSACFPSGTALAATWNLELVQQVGSALGDEVHSKGAHALLAPTVNIHRSPLGGRNFECYSEDPYLTSRLALAYIGGLQSKRVAATIKHFAGNDSEFQRNSINSVVDERTLREIYLPPFETAVREGKVWAIMTAYNRLNGTHCDANSIVNDVLKNEWGFDGLAMSDWMGTTSTAPSANNGLDLEMPGPAVHMGEKLLAAVRAGEVSEDTVNEHVRRLLRLAERTGALEATSEPEERSENRPEHQRIARVAAAEAVVLLKNDAALLPLEPGKLGSIAVIGANAENTVIQGGGSAQLRAHYSVSILDGIRQAAVGTKVEFARGCVIDKFAPVLDATTLENGFTLEYFAGDAATGTALLTETVSKSSRMSFEAVQVLQTAQFFVRGRGRMKARVTGPHQFALSSVGPSRLRVNGALIVDNWDTWAPGGTFFGFGSDEIKGSANLEAGQVYEIELETIANPERPLLAFSIGCFEPQPSDLLEQAVALAARCDVAVVVVGTNKDWETEGLDRSDMSLPGRQVELIQKVAAANPNTVVVVNAGSPIELEWASDVKSVLMSWFAGQEAGNAVADVLFGHVNPSGHLPTTFPKRLEDNPAYINYPGENGAVHYGEGIFVGYRYYDKKRVEPAYPFGHGLSYTSFEYGPVTLSSGEIAAKDAVTVSVTVKNTGQRAGQEVVQLYVRDLESRVARPERELKAFAKIALEAGASTEVKLELNPRSFAFWDTLTHDWVVEPGEFEISLGSSSRDLRGSARLRVKG